MARTALQLLAQPDPFHRVIELDDSLPHSLHGFPDVAGGFLPEEASFFIEQHCQKGDKVLDLYCGAGNVALSAALYGCYAFSTDPDPLCSRITAAKLSPADLTEVTLGIQQIDLSRPVDLSTFSKHFSPFFDLETFREVANIRRFTRAGTSRHARFVELLMLSLLHGSSAGYLSCYSPTHYCLSPTEQDQLNNERSHLPDYRSSIPRILRRSASVLRDSLPSALFRSAQGSRVELGDPRDLTGIPCGFADLCFVALPCRRRSQALSRQWLRRWFAGVPQYCEDSLFSGGDISGSLNELCLEVARAVKRHARVIISFPDERQKKGVHLAAMREAIEAGLARYFSIEGIFERKISRGIRVHSRQFLSIVRL